MNLHKDIDIQPGFDPVPMREPEPRVVVRTRVSMAATFWAFVLGVVVALAVAAAAVLWISKAPVPFVSKVSQRASAVDPALLDGKSIDPNRKLYGGKGAGDAKDAAQPAPTAGAPASPAAKPAPGTVVTADVYWLDTPPLKAADAEGVKMNIAMVGVEYGARTDKAKRVILQVGPFASLAEAEEIRQILSGNGVSTTAVRRKAER
ncbi:MAG: hypothetical protein HUK26_04140 [Duodenibacillus sp.]|nr:hypothetical protein [Duodenibacillus sp.]